MPQFPELSDDELAKRLPSFSGPLQQAMIAELHRRDSAKVQSEIANVRDTVSSIRTDLSTVQVELKTLEKSHRVHLWILAAALVTGALALIAALDVVLKWIRCK